MKRKEQIGIFLLCIEPIIHNIHNFALQLKMQGVSLVFYKELYFFLFAFLHSFAPLVALIGCFLLIHKNARYFILIPASYQLYKSLEKIPLRRDYQITDEFLLLSVLFVSSFVLLIWYKSKKEIDYFELYKQDLEKQSEKHLENIKKELNL